MKNILFKLLIPTVLIAGLASCKKSSFLDQTSQDILDQQKVFADSALTLAFLNNIYAYMGQDIVPTRSTGAGLINSAKSGSNDYACLEDLTVQSASYYGQPQADQVTSASTSADAAHLNYYSVYYARIRACNQYMLNVKTGPLSAQRKQQTTGEARFLRAWYYAEMVRIFGGVKLVGDTIYSITDEIPYTRNTYKDCIDYIVKECDAAAALLPAANVQSPTDYGRITSGACLALKARMLLTAASPLFNGTPATSSATYLPYICYAATYDPSLWQKAADAFKAVMNLGMYSLYVDNSIPGNGFRGLFLIRQNSEYILPFMRPPSNEIESWRFPSTRAGGGTNGGSSTPSQNLVDAFGMSNGAAINDVNSGYDLNNPYVNRDPRFYHTIIFNQAKLYFSTTQKMDPVNIYGTVSSSGVYTPQQDGMQSYHTRTGYYCAKMANDSVVYTVTKDRVYPLIRYAEILLGYAEALNEIQGPTTDVYQLIAQIRNRAGIQPGVDNSYGLKPGLSKEDMRRIIQNEYNVELAYEGHRYFDIRRWKIAEVTEASPIQGMQITLQSNGTFLYTRTNAIVTAFITPKMYFQPIPLAETGKSLTMVQNPGW